MRTRHNDLETFLLIAIGWIGILSIIFELFTVVNPNSTPILNEFNNITLSFANVYNIKAFTPPITISNYNHFVILSSIPLFILGLYVTLKNGNSKKHTIFLFLQSIYFLCQILGFVMAGLYPIPAALMALLTGGALYVFGTCLLTKCNK
jgi:uncharacterized membrane protein